MDGFSLTFTEAVCLGASLSLSSIFYYLHKKKRKTVKKLENAPHIGIDGQLKNLLEVSPGACLQYVVVEGTVKPVDEPLTSQFNKDVSGVLQKFTIKEHRQVWSNISRSCFRVTLLVPEYTENQVQPITAAPRMLDSERIVHQRVNKVPFVLVGSDQAAVKVQSPLQADGVYTEITNEKFYQATYSVGEFVEVFFSGEKSKGHLEIEEMLKVGTTLTGVGELILDKDGTLTLRPPSDNSPYFLTMADFESLRNETDTIAACWKVLAIISALAGTAVLLWASLRFYRTLKVHWEQDRANREFARLQAEAARSRANRAYGEGPQDGANSNHVENVCVICLSEPRDCILLDCAHVCCCYVCYQTLPQKRCPICRQNIVRVLPYFQA